MCAQQPEEHMRNLIFSLLIACGGKTIDTSSTDTEADLANGESVYQSCLACHPSNGIDVGAVAPDLSDAELESIIKDGDGGMPAQSALSDDDVRDVIAYIRATFP